MPEKLTIKPLNELMLKEYPPQRWVVEKLIPQGGLVMMSASPASYKTWLMLQVALSVAKGEEFINAFHTEQRHRHRHRHRHHAFMMCSFNSA